MLKKKKIIVKKVIRKGKAIAKSNVPTGKKRKIIGPLLIIFVLALIALAVYAIYGPFKSNNVKEGKIPTCGDGSFYDTCSIKKPYLCEKGELIEAARFCGCSEGFRKDGDQCVSDFNKNPKEIVLPYLFNSQRREVNFTMYKGLYDYLGNASRFINYNGEEKLFRVDFKFQKINEKNQKEFLLPLVVEIQNLASDKIDQARIAISLVQNIKFGESNKLVNVTKSQTLPYSRYPYEVLYEDEGICGEKSELLSFLLRELGFGTVLFYNKFENHESVGIACPVEESYWNSGYCFVETSAPSILSDDEISYAGNVKLISKPEIMFISDGVSLGKDLQEYKDAKEFGEIRQKIEEGKKLSSSESRKLDELNKRYGLVEIYNA